MKLSVIIPAKNEEKGLARLLPQLMSLTEIDEVIVVDDGSTDNTRELSLKSGAKVISHHHSMGNGAAIKAGARAAESEWIIFMDADGQHQAADVIKLIAKQKETNADMVVGARDRNGQAGFARHVANSFYNWFASIVTEFQIKDLTSGFRMVNRRKFLEFLPLLPNKFSYPTTITMTFFRAGYIVEYQAVSVQKREGKSHIRPLRDGFRFFIIIFKVATLYAPLRVFVPLAAFHFFLGLARYAYTYIVQGTFTNMSALLMVTAVQIFLIGLISEQISALAYKRN